MFEPVKRFWCCPEWDGSLSRLDSELFSMPVDSAFRAAPHPLGKLILNTTSSLIRLNQ
jgi:hypothetical protein